MLAQIKQAWQRLWRSWRLSYPSGREVCKDPHCPGLLNVRLTVEPPVSVCDRCGVETALPHGTLVWDPAAYGVWIAFDGTVIYQSHDDGRTWTERC